MFKLLSRVLVPGTAVLALIWHSDAFAQAIPGTVDPGRLEQQFKPPLGPSPIPDVVTPESPEVVPPTDAANIRFLLRQVNIDGLTVFSEEQLKPLYNDVIDHEVSLADVFRIAEAITSKYRSDGYILTRAVVPAQRISNGMVRISVVEGFLNKVIIQGKKTPAIQALADRLLQSPPLTNQVLQRYLLLINDLSGVQARAVLAPSTDALGGSDLTLVIEDKSLDFSANLDNRGSKYIGPMQFVGEAAINDTSGLSDRMSFRYSTTPVAEDELRYFELGYALPLGSDGMKFEMNTSGNQSSPGSILHTSALKTEANSESATVKLSYAYLRSQTDNLFADISFTLRNSNFDQFSLPSRTKMTSSYEDRIRALRAGVSYDTLDVWGGRDFVRFEMSQGLTILNASPNGSSSNTSRDGGRSNFTKGSLDVSRQQNLNSVTPGLSLMTAASGAGTLGQQLLASEQFGVGGSQFGRGYDSSELTGDYGAAGKIELQYLLPSTLKDEGRPSSANVHVL